MITQRDLDLLSDLAKLLKKYGPKSFENLQTLLTSGEFESIVVGILATHKTIEGKERSMTRPQRASGEKPKMTIRTHLSLLKKSQPKKYKILEGFYKQAKSKRILATREEAIRFALELGLGISRKASRESIIAKTVRHLSRFPEDHLEDRIKEIVERSKHAQTLEGWADVILKRRKKS